MDTKNGQEVHYLPNNQTREDLVNRINADKKALAMHEAWLYSMKSSGKSKKKVVKKKKNYREVDGILIQKK